MNRFFTQLSRLNPLARATSSAQATEGVAQNLMERAEAKAGRSPQQAQELRIAACAYLSVVR
jgi:hypothetical protein